MRMSLGNRLTWFLLVGVLVVTALDLYWSLTRTRANLIADLQREVAAISRTLQVTLDISGDDTPWRYFDKLAAGISRFENILGLVFYDREGRIAAISVPLQGHTLPQVDVPRVITTRIPVEGIFNEGNSADGTTVWSRFPTRREKELARFWWSKTCRSLRGSFADVWCRCC